jgi:hypothetical protein
MIEKITDQKNVGNKICQNCWYYADIPATNSFLYDPAPLKDSPYCEFNDDFSVVNPDNTCENWKCKKENLISVIKTLYGL